MVMSHLMMLKSAHVRILVYEVETSAIIGGYRRPNAARFHFSNLAVVLTNFWFSSNLSEISLYIQNFNIGQMSEDKL